MYLTTHDLVKIQECVTTANTVSKEGDELMIDVISLVDSNGECPGRIVWSEGLSSYVFDPSES